jgi:hypothetical protein
MSDRSDEIEAKLAELERLFANGPAAVPSHLTPLAQQIINETTAAARAAADAVNADTDQLQRLGAHMAAQRGPGAALTIRADCLGAHPVLTLDGQRLRGLRGVTLDWHRGDIAPVARLEIDLEHVDLDVLTLCWLIGRTQSPATVEEAIRALKKIKGEMSEDRP